ncbi:NUDIX domain-containing protein [Cytobacillus sp.]|uniref:NUDIX hydrolase n=1 Tax=Cytobacillus sp. TaxID=2675269 RepID=UPI0028BEC670|nr:NUDIX domain-containing protein [Cytobacillus sp.]
MQAKHTFGKKDPNKAYIKRPAVYAVIFNETMDKTAVVQADSRKSFLLGGGIEGEETHIECLKREAIEELGVEIKIKQYIGYAERYFFSTKEYKNYLGQGYFYICQLGKKICDPIEEDHHLIWMEIDEAQRKLFHEHQSWAVKTALELSRQNDK